MEMLQRWFRNQEKWSVVSDIVDGFLLVFSLKIKIAFLLCRYRCKRNHDQNRNILANYDMLGKGFENDTNARMLEMPENSDRREELQAEMFQLSKEKASSERSKFSVL